ncbi:hypothetical protein BcepSauron_286 [Burkholderia phage BcepSauron]|uniref:Uncharacterized protein n=1 Tax=Burkholderia phage BcepSauron TaxID=2530033 RepID=A0A482MMB7_9CAUD|nr:hypothetical protein H1O17_gp286 [Burkholderia phage BcepSauron]QBQ74666.1 hypothetical protein BcepSauron_286 [Burkholderia phage BcepSauron]
MKYGVTFYSNLNVLNHVDNSREIGMFVKSVLESEDARRPLENIELFRAARDRLNIEIEKRFGSGMEVVLLDAEDFDFEADEFSDAICVSVRSKEKGYTVQ